MSLLTSPTKLLGPLEWRVLDALWRRDQPGTVRDLQPSFPEIAYTTLMTTLDRLYRKDILNRTKEGRAFVYAPLLSRAAFDSQRATRALLTAVERGGGARPVLSCFVEAIGNHDEALLTELETLVRARRAERDAQS
ncbi:MAG: BlaI/MecI/CopY family transcriptional regulator [Acidobacteria bacterium]|jgi:predicted transcriptional regulator|nr:BlaI/MecI/CopY family transcriptional regulator [Acidobacteriota bacterium]